MAKESSTPREANGPAVKLKYSKSSSFYLGTKGDFFTENDALLLESERQNQLYASQPVRVLCKICESPLSNVSDFKSHGVEYVFCSDCSHLNGRFEDTEAFYSKLYTYEGGVEYNSGSYIDGKFHQRAQDVYIPKVDFLINSIPPKKYQVLDIGCGGGYFVYAALLRNLTAVGLDVSKTSIDFGNDQLSKLIGSRPLSLESEQGFYEAITKSKAEIISAIGVIEHLREPQRFFDAFMRSESQYLYYSVPMFSFSVALENVFKEIFPRQLAVDHTHLFTEGSIKRMNNKMGVKSIAEWRFGTDAMDLYRHIFIALQKNNSSQKMLDYMTAGFGNKIDELQEIFDKNHFCSEIHCVVAKN